MRDTTAGVEIGEACLHLVVLPAFRLDEGGDRFRGEERLRAAGPLGQGLELPLLGARRPSRLPCEWIVNRQSAIDHLAGL